VSSGANLRERIAYRDSAYELGYYEDLRWTERPETYVRRELGRVLFETLGLRRVLTGAAPTLDVELIAFDELRTRATRFAQVQLMVILYDDHGVIFEETQTTEAPVAGEAAKVENVIAAMATALCIASTDLALKVSKALASRELTTPTEPAP
jgi:cholesterol transport system auxiliary component